jgi:hypothetical protein
MVGWRVWDRSTLVVLTMLLNVVQRGEDGAFSGTTEKLCVAFRHKNDSCRVDQKHCSVV